MKKIVTYKNFKFKVERLHPYAGFVIILYLHGREYYIHINNPDIFYFYDNPNEEKMCDIALAYCHVKIVDFLEMLKEK